MNKLWLIFRYEYLRHVRRKRFIFALLSMPFMILLMVGVGYLAIWADYDNRPIGYVDLDGILISPQPAPKRPDDLFPDPPVTRFASEVEARAELESNKIQGYYVIQPNYLENGSVKFFTLTQPKDSTKSAFTRFMRYNLVSKLGDDVSKRIVDGLTLEVRSLEGTRRMNENDFLSIMLPMLAGILFLIVVNISGTYLVSALVEEKENRTMEIMVTSVSPNQLMAGKVIGNLAVGLTQLIVWVIFGLIALRFVQTNLLTTSGQAVDPGFLWLTILTIVPAFVMIAGLMATAGATTADTSEAQQVAGLFTLPVVLPFMLIAQLMEAPNSPLSIALSLFPLTAPISLPLRYAFTEVPLWQIVLAISLLFLGAVGAIWLAGRAFRLGMLRYGKGLTWREIFRKA